MCFLIPAWSRKHYYHPSKNKKQNLRYSGNVIILWPPRPGGRKAVAPGYACLTLYRSVKAAQSGNNMPPLTTAVVGGFVMLMSMLLSAVNAAAIIVQQSKTHQPWVLWGDTKPICWSKLASAWMKQLLQYEKYKQPCPLTLYQTSTSHGKRCWLCVIMHPTMAIQRLCLAQDKWVESTLCTAVESKDFLHTLIRTAADFSSGSIDSTYCIAVGAFILRFFHKCILENKLWPEGSKQLRSLLMISFTHAPFNTVGWTWGTALEF